MVKNIIILILFLALVGVIVFLDMPEVQGVLNLRKQIKDQQAIFSDKQLLLAKVDNLKGAYEENKEDLKKTDYILPSGQDIPDLIAQVEGLAFENGLVLGEVGLTSLEAAGEKAKTARVEQKGAKDYQILTVNLKLIGSYSAFKNFLKAVEDNIRLMDIDLVNFNTEKEKGSQIFEFEVSLNTYYQ
jgi:Tfp pilus assembly protein PilO